MLPACILIKHAKGKIKLEKRNNTLYPHDTVFSINRENWKKRIKKLTDLD